jgi:hypothetical protein
MLLFLNVNEQYTVVYRMGVEPRLLDVETVVEKSCEIAVNKRIIHADWSLLRLSRTKRHVLRKKELRGKPETIRPLPHDYDHVTNRRQGRKKKIHEQTQ